jgi:hypothetical protein
MSLRGAEGDEAISAEDKDCFAEFILSEAEGLAMTPYDILWGFCPVVLTNGART